MPLDHIDSKQRCYNSVVWNWSFRGHGGIPTKQQVELKSGDDDENDGSDSEDDVSDEAASLILYDDVHFDEEDE